MHKVLLFSWLTFVLASVLVNRASADVITGISIENVSHELIYPQDGSVHDRTANHLIDGSGLDLGGVPGAHSNTPDETDKKAGLGTMWMGRTTAPASQWVAFDLGKLYDLKSIRIWNYNEWLRPGKGDLTDRGVKEMDVLVSANNRQWTKLGRYTVARATGSTTADFSQTIPLVASSVRYVRFDVHSNYGAEGQVGLSEVRFNSFEAATNPYATGPEPGNGAVSVGQDADLGWSAGVGADSHNVYFGTDPKKLVKASPGQMEPSYDLGSLESGKTYYWRVDEVKGSDMWTGTVWNFTTVHTKAHNPAPADAIEVTLPDIDLSWSPGVNADSHNVYFGTDPRDLTKVSIGHTKLIYDPGTLKIGQTYYWRIDEVSGTKSRKGNVWSFTVAPAPEKCQRRIIMNQDQQDLWQTDWKTFKGDPKLTQKYLEGKVDGHAAAQVDTIVHCVFAAFKGHLPYSKVAGIHMIRPSDLDAAGIDFLQVILDRCRKHNIEFLAALRMNDRHRESKGWFINEHPEWRLSIGGGSMNYAHKEVRQAMLTFVEEVLDRYDVDGIEFDYMRHCHVYEPGQGSKNAHLLTEFTRKARKMLDDAGRRRGRGRLILGVRVPQRLKECEYLGFDVATWIKEGLVDYVTPSDFLYTDVNARTEDFVKLAKGTDCKIYPANHPDICEGTRARRIDIPNYLAAAKNFYAFGADGLSFYNTTPLDYFPELHDRERILQGLGGDRHYLFHPLRTADSTTGLRNDTRIFLDRAQSGSEGSQRFRVAEDFKNPKLRGKLQFKAVGLKEKEALEIKLNDTDVPVEFISRVFDEDGQTEIEGRVLEPFYLYVIDLTGGIHKPLIVNGDNKLTIHLIRPARDIAEGAVIIDELEFLVLMAPLSNLIP